MEISKIEYKEHNYTTNTSLIHKCDTLDEVRNVISKYPCMSSLFKLGYKDIWHNVSNYMIYIHNDIDFANISITYKTSETLKISIKFPIKFMHPFVINQPRGYERWQDRTADAVRFLDEEELSNLIIDKYVWKEYNFNIEGLYNFYIINDDYIKKVIDYIMK